MEGHILIDLNEKIKIWTYRQTGAEMQTGMGGKCQESILIIILNR